MHSAEIVSIEVDCLAKVDDIFIEFSLSTKEKQRYNSIKFDKKKIEWLAGRIAAKFSLSYALRKPFSEIEIFKDENRSPYSLINEVKTHVSITHSKGMALSTVGDKTVDLELIADRNPAFIDESYSSEEVQTYDLRNADAKLITMLWTMKEAHLKRMRIGLKADLHGVLIDELVTIKQNNFSSIVKSPQGESRCESFIGTYFIVTISSSIH